MAKVNDMVSVSTDVMDEYKELFLESKDAAVNALNTELGIIARSKDYELKKDEPNKDRLRFIESQEKRLQRVLRFVERVRFHG